MDPALCLEDKSRNTHTKINRESVVIVPEFHLKVGKRISEELSVYTGEECLQYC